MTALGRWLVCGAMVAASASTTLARPAQERPLVTETWTVDGVERSALVAVPAEVPAKATVPVVLVFHGHGGTSAQAARSFRIHEAWPEAVVIYPQGLAATGRIIDLTGELAGWQFLPETLGDRDVHLVDAMLAWAKKRYTVDSEHTFAAGHSNGGSMVYVLWAARPDKFAAFAPSSSVFPAALIRTSKPKPKPAFIVAGREDPLVPFALQQLSLEGVLRINEADHADQEWSAGARRHLPLKGGRGAEVVAYIHPGGHQLPADAGALMVRFFKSQ